MSANTTMIPRYFVLLKPLSVFEKITKWNWDQDTQKSVVDFLSSS